MEPVKVIHNYKNNYQRTQYLMYIFIGDVSEEIMLILNKIKKLGFYKSLEILSNKELSKLSDMYGDYWYGKLYHSKHIESELKKINGDKNMLNRLKSKMSDNWMNEHIIKKSIIERDLLFSFETKYMLDMKDKKIDVSLRRELDFRTFNKIDIKDVIQSGGNDEEEYDEDTIDDISDEEIERLKDEDEKEELDMGDEVIEEEIINTTELTHLGEENILKREKSDISKTADLLAIALNEKNWEKNEMNNRVEYNNKNDENTFDMDMENIIEKNYIKNNYIFGDDDISKIREKISYSIPLNSKFGKDLMLLPERQYLYSSYKINDVEDNVMIGQKWVRRNELLKIDVIPNPNIKIYENLRGNLSYLRDSFNMKLRREDDDNLILNDYNNFITMNEIYLCDIYNYIGLDYNPSIEEKKNLYDVFVSIYYPYLSYQNFENIIKFVNRNGDDEIDIINIKKRVILTDIKLENEITGLVEKTKREKRDEINKLFGKNYILNSIININVSDKSNITGTINDTLNLYAIFDGFIVSKEYPLIQYNSLETGIIHKIYEKSDVLNNSKSLGKWFNINFYGLSIKRIYNDKDIIFTLNENGKIEYKITWKEIDNITIEDIKKTYNLVRDLIIKMNNETRKVKIIIPDDNRFEFAFVNSIQKFNFEGNRKISHNDLSDFARYFYPYIVLVIDPKKRIGKTSKEDISKYGSYFRYKRISRFDNRMKMHIRILYYIKKFDLTERELITEIAKLFNLTEMDAAKELDIVREKYSSIIRRSQKLKKLKTLPRGRPPGIGIDIQGRDAENYKVRVSGSRDKKQLDNIIGFINTLLYLYSETYLKNNKKYEKILEKLKSLNKVAKRRNKVLELVDYENEKKGVKELISLDKRRLGFKPGDGESQYSRLCQNSGKKKRQPKIISGDNIRELISNGFEKDSNSDMYIKRVKEGKNEIIIRAVPLGSEEGKVNYYYCDPAVNKDFKYIGFLVRGNNPDGLCLPCCFKKDQYIGDNEVKKLYFKKCVGEVNDYKVEKRSLEGSLDKLYILQEGSKIQEGRFLFLPKYLDILLNRLWDNSILIKNNYMKTSEGYYLKFTVKDKEHHFASALLVVLDLTLDELIDKIISFIEKKENEKYFYYLNNGEIYQRFDKVESYVNFIRSRKYLEEDVIGELITLPGVIYENGLNYFIINKKVGVKEQYMMECLNKENSKYINRQDRNNIILIKDKKHYLPIMKVKRIKVGDRIEIIKKFDYENKSDNIVMILRDLYNRSCEEDILSLLDISKTYYGKSVIEKFSKYNLRKQVLDVSGKVRYIKYEGFTIPVSPSGLDYNYEYMLGEITLNSLKNVLSENKIISKVDNGYEIDKLLYDRKEKEKFVIEGVMFKNRLILPIKTEKLNEKEINKLKLKTELRPLDTLIDNIILTKKDIMDNKRRDVLREKYINEGYNLFRFELSEYLSKVNEGKEKIIHIVRGEESNEEKRTKLRSLLVSLVNPKLMSMMKVSNVKRYVYMIISRKEGVDVSNLKISNTREYCLVNKSKDSCNSLYCKWDGDVCKFSMEDSIIIEYINQLIEEMLMDGVGFKEIIREDDYFVSDIVNRNNFTFRKDTKLIKIDTVNINKILGELFGEQSLPDIGRKRRSSIIIDENENVELEQIGKQYRQKIVSNQNSIIRGYVNGLYWLKNSLYDIDRRNLGYNSIIQNELTLLLKAMIIDYVLNNKNERHPERVMKYFERPEELKSKLMEFSKSRVNTNGELEYYVLNKIFNIPIIVLNKFNEYHLGFEGGKILTKEKEIEKLIESDSIKIQLDVSEDNLKPRNITVIY